MTSSRRGEILGAIVGTAPSSLADRNASVPAP
jgi:hypothetical protein